jgi:shikimate dehydrogenase
MRTERYSVIGDPISHTLSPVMQAAAFEAAGIPAVYEAHPVSADMLGPHVACLRLGYSGFNVTVPHKQAIVRELDEVYGAARRLRAANTVVVQDEKLLGYNTDPAGFLFGLGVAGFDPGGVRALIFGAGGAARAVALGLCEAGASVTVISRSRPRADDLAGSVGIEVRVIDPAELPQMLPSVDLLVNATPLGQPPFERESPLVSVEQLRVDCLVYDLVYGRETPLLAAARRRGLQAIDGLEMLIGQGAAAFSIWTGVEADRTAMRAACMRALEGQACSAS